MLYYSPLSYSNLSNIKTRNYNPTKMNHNNTVARSNPNIITLFTKSPNTNVDRYSSPYGVPFECIEFIRRILTTQTKFTFRSIRDAEDMFYNIKYITHILNNNIILPFETYHYPYASNNELATKKILSYLKPGNLLFWKKAKTYALQYGHVAIITYADNFIVKIAQQNFNPPIQTYYTPDLVARINNPRSEFIGIKVFPKNIRDFLSDKLKNIQVRHIEY